MRSHVHLRPVAAFDLFMAAAFGLVALAAFLATGRPRAALATVHGVASHIGWRESYETGLIVGLGAIAIIAVVVLALVVLIRQRA